MPSAETAQRDEPSGLAGSRAEFAASLTRRLESVLGALSALEQQPSSGGRRDNFLRRVHALSASARVLGFAAAAETFARAEQQIRTSQIDTLADDILAVQKYLAELPNLVLRGAYSLAPPCRPAAGSPSAPSLITEPLAVVVWGTPDLVETLRSLDNSTHALEVTSVADPTKLRDLCLAMGPDILLLDANQGSITLLLDELAQAPELTTIAIVVANVPDDAAPGLLELGARLVLPAQASEQQLSKALLQARHVSVERAATPVPLGELTLKDLAERLAQEIREGLVDAATPGAHLQRIAFGDGTPIRAAIWSALAQIREQIVETSAGRIQFATGPEGGIPMAPRNTGAARGGGHTSVDTVDLVGRRILVADDDPAVAWFVGGTLRAAGAVVTEVHNGTQALEVAYRIWPELIVSDVMMPGLDGFALCHAIKRDVLLRDVPVVLLSWKEDLLFRLRDLGADADGYLRKEADASTIVRRVRELLMARSALERRLLTDGETRGRLDGTTTRVLLELATSLERPVRIALRDASALYDIRARHGSLASVTRTRHDGTTEHGQSVISSMLGITAGRFSVTTDREPCEPMFSGSLQEIVRPSVLRARAAQRVLSGLTLGLIDRLTLEQDAFGSDLPLLPMSLRPIADELMRGTAPRQLLASGVASVQLLESLLSDVARRGAVRAIANAQGEDLLEQEILALSSTPSIVPPKPAHQPPPLFTFQLSPPAPEVREIHSHNDPTPTSAPAVSQGSATTVGRSEILPPQPEGGTRDGNSDSVDASNSPALPTPSMRSAAILPSKGPSNPDDVDWAAELSWDSTPAPARPDAPASAGFSVNKPTTSGGFMRPTIATLERRPTHETPDLANAVVRAVSEGTPAPVAADKPTGAASRDAGTEADIGAIAHETAMGSATVAAMTSAAVAPPTILNVMAPAIPAAPSHPDTAKRPDTAIATSVGAGGSTVTGAKSDLLGQPQAKTAPPQGSELAAAGALVAAPTVPAEARTLVSPQHPTVEVLSPFERAPFAESPTALPAVHQPPRPQAEPAVKVSDLSEPRLGDAIPDPVAIHASTDRKDRDSEDPVFPLVSTANVSVEIQPSIDVEASSSQSAMPAAIGSELPPPTHLQNRDTLRSPGDAPSERPKSAESPGRSSDRQQATVAVNPSAVSLPPSSERAAPSLNVASAASSDPRAKTPMPSPVPQGFVEQPRPVGWIQALGLAALAGIVTFAVTVPVASWVRKRHEPVATEPPVAAETMSNPAGSSSATPENNGALSASVPLAPSPGDAAAAAAPSTSSATPPIAPTIEAMPVPSDVTLQAGQAVIEVTTGGGHAIFVDDSFVGRGPVRVITVEPGKHIVRTRLNGVERSDPIEVGAGRGLRLSLEQTWK